eukprot:9201373-Alexandrium_andersonii.AAC.1
MLPGKRVSAALWGGPGWPCGVWMAVEAGSAEVRGTSQDGSWDASDGVWGGSEGSAGLGT